MKLTGLVTMEKAIWWVRRILVVALLLCGYFQLKFNEAILEHEKVQNVLIQNLILRMADVAKEREGPQQPTGFSTPTTQVDVLTLEDTERFRFDNITIQRGDKVIKKCLNGIIVEAEDLKTVGNMCYSD